MCFLCLPELIGLAVLLRTRSGPLRKIALIRDKGTVRDEGEVASAGALRVELLSPPPTYPVDGESWTEVGSKRARKRARKKKKGKKGKALA